MKSPERSPQPPRVHTRTHRGSVSFRQGTARTRDPRVPEYTRTG